MSTYSSNLKIELIGTGEQAGTWGTTTNDNFANVFEQAIVGRITVLFATDANKTLTATNTVNSQDYRNLYLNLTSTGSLTVTRDLIVPTNNKTYVVQNNTTGAQSIRVITAAGTGITVPNGRTAALYVDGTNVIVASDFFDINGGSIDGTPIGASSASTGAFTTATVTTGNITTVNATTVDTTNIEVTNIKAKDGVASATIADSTGVMTIASSVLTTADINGGTIDATAIGLTTRSTGAFTTLAASGDGTFSGTGQLKLPAGTTAQRSGSPADGMMRYNTDEDSFEGYIDGVWGGISGAQANGVIYENNQVVTSDYTITAGKNGMSAGEISINSGVTVTIPSGSNWVIL